MYTHMYVHTHFHVYNIFSDIYIQNMSKIMQTDPCPSLHGSLTLNVLTVFMTSFQYCQCSCILLEPSVVIVTTL